MLSQWIRRAEEEAGLEKLQGGTAHPYRRKWRSERRDVAPSLVAAAGGWEDSETMNRSYDIVDERDLLAATADFTSPTPPRGAPPSEKGVRSAL